MFFRAPPQGRLSSFPSQSSPSLARMTALKALEVRGHRHILDFVVFLMPWLQSQAQSHVLIQPPASSPGREGGSALSISSPTETPRPVLGPSRLRAELQGWRADPTRARDGTPSLGWQRRPGRLELSATPHLLGLWFWSELGPGVKPRGSGFPGGPSPVGPTGGRAELQTPREKEALSHLSPKTKRPVAEQPLPRRALRDRGAESSWPGKGAPSRELGARRPGRGMQPLTGTCTLQDGDPPENGLKRP